MVPTDGYGNTNFNQRVKNKFYFHNEYHVTQQLERKKISMGGKHTHNLLLPETLPIRNI